MAAGETPAVEQPSDLPGTGSAKTGAADAAASGAAAGPAYSTLIYCVRCGAVMSKGDAFCHECGWDARAPLPAPRIVRNPSERNRLAALLLCVLIGWLGAHRFYVGKIGTGVLWLVSFGFLGVGVIYDLVLIATGEFRDGEGRRVVNWQ